METAHEERIARLERDVRRLDLELESLRPHKEAPKPPPTVVRPPAPARFTPRPAPPVPPRIVEPRRSFDPADLLGARALAWVGGVLLAAGFFYQRLTAEEPVS